MKKYLIWFTERIGKDVLMTPPGQTAIEITIEGWTHARLLYEDYLLKNYKFEDK